MVTLKEVARAAGVSVDTVSRVMNRKNKESWSCTARRAEEIRRIATTLGFRPNAAARTVQSGRFNRIAFVVTCYEQEGRLETFEGRGYFPAAIYTLAELGYSVIPVPVFMDMHTRQMKNIPHLFSETAVDGILALDGTGEIPVEIDQFIEELKVPTVWLNRNPVPGVPCVNSDEITGGRSLTRHLIDLGHKKIGYIGYRYTHYASMERPMGVGKELISAGLDPSGICFLTPHQWLESMDRFLDDPNRPTGIICITYLTYQMVLHSMSRRGLSLPKDFSLCCFSSAGEQSKNVPFTTWLVPEKEMAEKGIAVLMRLISENPFSESEYKVQGSLIIGNSTSRLGEV
jgi:DNA-binding LacI/PurR family transcriptional regulator